jgi:hypothetical protein
MTKRPEGRRDHRPSSSTPRAGVCEMDQVWRCVRLYAPVIALLLWAVADRGPTVGLVIVAFAVAMHIREMIRLYRSHRHNGD